MRMLKLKLGKKKDAAPAGDDANLPAVADGEGGEGAGFVHISMTQEVLR